MQSNTTHLPELAGFLLKLHKKTFGPKQKRFCTVRNDGLHGPCLLYYSSIQQCREYQDPNGSIFLKEVSDIPLKTGAKQFSVVTPHRTWKFLASTPEEAVRWVDGLVVWQKWYLAEQAKAKRGSGRIPGFRQAMLVANANSNHNRTDSNVSVGSTFADFDSVRPPSVQVPPSVASNVAEKSNAEASGETREKKVVARDPGPSRSESLFAEMDDVGGDDVRLSEIEFERSPSSSPSKDDAVDLGDDDNDGLIEQTATDDGQGASDATRASVADGDSPVERSTPDDQIDETSAPNDTAESITEGGDENDTRVDETVPGANESEQSASRDSDASSPGASTAILAAGLVAGGAVAAAAVAVSYGSDGEEDDVAGVEEDGAAASDEAGGEVDASQERHVVICNNGDHYTCTVAAGPCLATAETESTEASVCRGSLKVDEKGEGVFHCTVMASMQDSTSPVVPADTVQTHSSSTEPAIAPTVNEDECDVATPQDSDRRVEVFATADGYRCRVISGARPVGMDTAQNAHHEAVSSPADMQPYQTLEEEEEEEEEPVAEDQVEEAVPGDVDTEDGDNTVADPRPDTDKSAEPATPVVVQGNGCVLTWTGVHWSVSVTESATTTEPEPEPVSEQVSASEPVSEPVSEQVSEPVSEPQPEGSLDEGTTQDATPDDEPVLTETAAPEVGSSEGATASEPAPVVATDGRNERGEREKEMANLLEEVDVLAARDRFNSVTQ